LRTIVFFRLSISEDDCGKRVVFVEGLCKGGGDVFAPEQQPLVIKNIQKSIIVFNS